jgi:hypothetical protein
MGDPQATNLPEMAAAAIASGDPAAMQATISQLVGAFAGLQNDVQHLLQQRTNEPSNPTPPLNAMPAMVSSLTDGDSKLKLPTPKSYDGSQTPGAVENFLFDCEQYFVAKGIPSDKQVFFASALLEGSAKTWWRFLCQRPGLELDTLFVWQTFHDQFLDRFRAVNANRHARDQLANLKQEGSVRTYAQKMQELAVQIPSVQDDELKDRFIRGLKTRTRMEVTMRDPETFEDAVKLANKFDSLFTPGLAGFGFKQQTP